MTEMVTLDSSVFVAALRREEEYFRACQSLLEKVKDGILVAVEPYTVLIEIAAAIRRRTGSQKLSERIAKDLLEINSINFLDMDTTRAKRAMEIAQRLGVRGMDAIVIQIADEFHTTLIGLDAEMLERAKDLVKITSPTDI